MIVVRQGEGGFALAPLIAGAQGVHRFLQGAKPVSYALNALKNANISIPNNRFGRIASRLASFAQDKLGYGYRRRKRSTKGNSHRRY